MASSPGSNLPAAIPPNKVRTPVLNLTGIVSRDREKAERKTRARRGRTRIGEVGEGYADGEISIGEV